MASSCFEWCPWVTFLDLGWGGWALSPHPLECGITKGRGHWTAHPLAVGRGAFSERKMSPSGRVHPFCQWPDPAQARLPQALSGLYSWRSNLRAWICLATALSSLACHHRGRRTPVAPHTLIRALWRWAHLSASLAVEWNCPRWQFSSLRYWFIWLGSGHWAGHSLGPCLRPSLPVSSKEGPSAITSS